MINPGLYTDQQLKVYSQDERMRGLISGILIGFVVGITATALFCYQKYGPAAQVPNLSLLIGDMRRAKEDCEGIVYSVKQRWTLHVISDLDSRTCSSDYRDLAARFNGISTALEAMLSTGHDNHSIEQVRANLIDAQDRYQRFRAWFDRLPKERPAAPRVHGNSARTTQFEALPELAIDLAKHFFDGMKEMDKLKRDHLIRMLQDLHFRQWAEIPGR